MSVRRGPPRHPGRRDASPPEPAQPSVRVASRAGSAHRGLHAQSAHWQAPPMSHARGNLRADGGFLPSEMPSEKPSPCGADHTHGSRKYSDLHPQPETNSHCVLQMHGRFPTGHRMYPAFHPRGHSQTPPHTWSGCLRCRAAATSTRGEGHQSQVAWMGFLKEHRIPSSSPFHSSARSGRCRQSPACPNLDRDKQARFRPLRRTSPCFYRLIRQAGLSCGPS